MKLRANSFLHSKQAAAKLTSTAVIVCSVYVLNRLRTKRIRSEQSMDSSSDLESSSVLVDESVVSNPFAATTSDTSPAASRQMLAHCQSYLHNGWRLVSRLLTTATSEVRQFPSARPAEQIVSAFSVEDMSACHNLVTQLAVEANISPTIRGLLTRMRGRLRFRGADKSVQQMLASFLLAFSTLTKDDLFVSLLLRNNDFCRLIEHVAWTFAGILVPDQVTQSDQSCSTQQSDSSSSVDVPVDSSQSMSELSASADTEAPAKLHYLDKGHPEYELCLHFVQALANVSRHPDSRILLGGSSIQRLLSLWSVSPSLHLTLFSQKVRDNLRAHLSSSNEASAIYNPDIFRLDRDESDANGSLPQFDVIFVHGMRGSVFYTWRQNDSSISDQQPHPSPPTKCWPRDWLSNEFPTARILALDAALNPFVWDPICPVDRFERTIDTRAKKLLSQLHAARVGQRPIVWVTHSAGGILVKELLRLSHTEQPSVSSQSISNPITCNDTSNLTTPDVVSPTESSRVRVDSNSIEGLSRPDNRTLSSTTINASTETHCDLLRHTVGVVFMSAPHRGNRSLFNLHRRPLRWTLTPEAIQLEPNSGFLLDLHSWFNRTAADKHLPVLTMVETRQTPLNRFWSVLLVPEDETDREMGRVVHIDSDHMYISKPRTPLDPAYVHIVQFIQEIRDRGIAREPTTS